MPGRFLVCIRYWLPVVAVMALIYGGSTDALSINRTSRFLGPFLRWLVPGISEDGVAAVQLGIRKTATSECAPREFGPLAGRKFGVYLVSLPNITQDRRRLPTRGDRGMLRDIRLRVRMFHRRKSLETGASGRT